MIGRINVGKDSGGNKVENKKIAEDNEGWQVIITVGSMFQHHSQICTVCKYSLKDVILSLKWVSPDSRRLQSYCMYYAKPQKIDNVMMLNVIISIKLY